MADHGAPALVVQRAIRSVEHCRFTQEEPTAAFTDLVAWAGGGQRPAGDDATDPQVVAQPTYGRRFTLGDGPGRSGPLGVLPRAVSGGLSRTVRGAM